MSTIAPLNITSFTLCSSLGNGVLKNLEALKLQQSGLKLSDFKGSGLKAYIGEVDGVNDIKIPDELARFDCRNNRLAYLCLQQDGFIDSVETLKEKYGKDRVGLFLGTSTSGIQQTELAYEEWLPEQPELPDWFDYDATQGTFSVADFAREFLDIRGVSQVIATACSSSAKVFASAWRHIENGYCDTAIVGGIDSLCLMTLYGFNSLQLVSEFPCRPADENRDGISIGEAAGFVILEKQEHSSATEKVQLLGFGESSDGYHMSTPHPEGKGAIKAMQQALDQSGCVASDVDYINLHGTATPANDQSEDAAVSALFPNVACSSTKGWTGHTLGAAGVIEAIFSILAIQNDFIPGSLNTQKIDTKLKSKIQLNNKSQSVSFVMSNSFGFGGNNCSLLLGEA